MSENSRPPPTALFMLRLWQAPLSPTRHEWRGEIKNLATEESRYFRTWAEIASLVPDMLDDAGGEWPRDEV
jgi:hypothetical protein